MGQSVFPVAASGVSGYAPENLTLQQTITSGTSVTIPAGINWAWAVVIAGGMGGSSGYAYNTTSSSNGGGGGGAGGVAYGWVNVSTSTPISVGAGGAGVAGVSNGGRRGGIIWVNQYFQPLVAA